MDFWAHLNTVHRICTLWYMFAYFCAFTKDNIKIPLLIFCHVFLSFSLRFPFLSFGCSASFHLNSSEKLQLFILYESDRFSRHVLFQSVKRICRIFLNCIGMGTVFIYEIIEYLYNISLNEFQEFLCFKYIFWMKHMCHRTNTYICVIVLSKFES